MLPLSLLSRHHPDAQVALQQSLILQDDKLQVNERWIGNQGRSVICDESLMPFTQFNEHSLETPFCARSEQKVFRKLWNFKSANPISLQILRQVRLGNLL